MVFIHRTNQRSQQRYLVTTLTVVMVVVLVLLTVIGAYFATSIVIQGEEIQELLTYMQVILLGLIIFFGIVVSLSLVLYGKSQKRNRKHTGTTVQRQSNSQSDADDKL